MRIVKRGQRAGVATAAAVDRFARLARAEMPGAGTETAAIDALMRGGTAADVRRALQGNADPNADAITTEEASEHEEQTAVVTWCHQHEDHRLRLIFAVPNAGKRSPQAANYYRAEGLKPGVPDLCLPLGYGGYLGMFIEMKVGDNDLSPLQEWWRDHLRGVGYYVIACWSSRAAIAAIRSYIAQAPTRGLLPAEWQGGIDLPPPADAI